MLLPEKVFTEIGYGNSSFVSSEIELPDGREYRQAGLVRMTIEGVYLRFWLGTRVFILSTREGLKMQIKDRSTIKLLFGIQGFKKMVE